MKLKSNALAAAAAVSLALAVTPAAYATNTANRNGANAFTAAGNVTGPTVRSTTTTAKNNIDLIRLQTIRTDSAHILVRWYLRHLTPAGGHFSYDYLAHFGSPSAATNISVTMNPNGSWGRRLTGRPLPSGCRYAGRLSHSFTTSTVTLSAIPTRCFNRGEWAQREVTQLWSATTPAWLDDYDHGTWPRGFYPNG